jgi:dTDP-4-dehydrorhamnose reductase
MNIIILGANGQVGHELQQSLKSMGNVIPLDRNKADLGKLDEVKQVLIDLKPDVIVNAAAYTAVDKAEAEPELAMLINGKAPGVIAEVVKTLDALFVHYSTDYVFDGTKNTAYTEDDKPNPINVYGKTKLAGEIAVQKSGCKYLIFRTSWVYSLHGHNFLKTILRLANEREELKIVDDQFGGPTWARTIADKTSECIPLAIENINKNQFKSALYHLTSTGETSWYGFAKNIIEKATNNGQDLKIKKVNPQPTSAYPTPAKRPMYSCLATKKISRDFSIELPDWSSALEECMQELVD